MPDTIIQKLKTYFAGRDEVVMALRYAKSQAIRTGKPHGVRITAADNHVRVFLQLAVRHLVLHEKE